MCVSFTDMIQKPFLFSTPGHETEYNLKAKAHQPLCVIAQ
jgi:hypothetical protein